MMVALVPLLLGLSTAGMWGTRGGTRFRSRPQCCTAADVDSAPVEAVLEAARTSLEPTFASIDRQTERSLGRVLEAFRRRGIGSHHFAGVDGYGHGDLGREALDEVYAELLGAEAALVRIQCFSGTHAIACALYGVLRPADELLAVSGAPYDTLEEVIGLRGRTDDGLRGTLLDFGVSYNQVELTGDGQFDLDAIGSAISAATRVIHVQRSCGYAWRRSIPIEEIGRLSKWLEAHHPSIVLFVDVSLPKRPPHTSPYHCAWQPKTRHSRHMLTLAPDLCSQNCYGEFVEELEPCAVGAHLVAGSLIKNPGGTLAPSGGYIAGRADLVAAASRRLAAPGVEGGATLGKNRLLFQGLFNAPQVVGEALKGACLVAHVMGSLGYDCNPPATAHRTDIIQAVKLRERSKVLAFCEAVQRCSPVGAHIRPVPGRTPGYGDEVIFADGTFVDGSTLELSADGPLREPFAVYVQGGTHWTHWVIVLRSFLASLPAEEWAVDRAAGVGGGNEREDDDAENADESQRYAGRRSLKNS